MLFICMSFKSVCLSVGLYIRKYILRFVWGCPFVYVYILYIHKGPWFWLMTIPGDFAAISSKRERNYVISCLLSCTLRPFWKGVLSKTKEFAPTGWIFFPFIVKHFQKGGKTIWQLSPLEPYSFPLTQILISIPLTKSYSNVTFSSLNIGNKGFCLLTLVLLNKLKCYAYFQFSGNQITWSSLLIQIHILKGKQCRSRSVGFFRSQLIWIYTVCKDRVYPGSAGQGLNILKQLYSVKRLLKINTLQKKKKKKKLV